VQKEKRAVRRFLNVRLLGLVLAVVPAALLVATHPSQMAQAAGAGYWHTSGAQVLDSNNQPVRIAGINWYGFETSDEVAHGLWAQDYHTIVNDIKALGYNTIRLPFSNQMVESNPVPSNLSFNNGSPINTDLRGLTSLQIMDKIITAAGQAGLRVILDNHRSEAGNSAEQNGLWYTSAYPQSAWVNDWAALARRYQGNTTVVGMDLRNEPHTPAGVPYTQGATWGTGDPNTDWQLAAQTAGNAILGVNPHLLIAVEGIGEFPDASAPGGFDTTWWGGDLQGVATHPVVLSTSNQVIYSAHDYGPNLFQQTWFNSSTNPQSLAGVWSKFWSYIYDQRTAPVWVGEFGTTNNAADISSTAAGSQGQWFSSLVSFIGARPAMGWTYWALNGEDPYALLDSQYHATPVSAQKEQALAGIQSSLSGGPTPTPTPSSSGTPTPTPTPTPTGGSGGVTVTPVVASNSPWFIEEDLKLANTGAVTSLSITITVQRTTGVSFSGQYNTVGGQIVQSTSSTSSVITDQFSLASGQTLNPGSGWTFAAQSSDSGTPHPTSSDSFTATWTAGGITSTLTGHF
jgi:endoglucanase